MVRVLRPVMMTNDKKRRMFRTHKGAALLVVLGIVMVITILAFAYLSRSDAELAYGRNMLLRTQADFLAESALEHARGLILNPQETSGEYWAGATSQQLEAGDFYYDVSVEPNTSFSGPTRWCNYDISCQAYKLSGGEHTAQSNLKALLRLNPCIAYYCRPVSAQQLSSAMTINGDIYCDNDLVIFDADAVNGDVFCDNLIGTITGQKYPSSDLSLDWPDVNVARFTGEYTFETVSSPLSGENKTFVKCDGDLEIEGNVHINGMLIVENGDLIISGSNNSIVATQNVPTLFVTGDITIEEDAEINIEGLAVINGKMFVNVDNADVNVLGGLFADGGIVEFTQDYGGGRRDGIIIGEPLWVSGRVGGAARFNGANEYLEVAQESPFDISQRITVAAWIKVNAFNRSYQAIVTKGDSAWRIQRYSNTSKIEFSCTGLSNWYMFSNGSVNDGQWHHVAGVYDGSRMYIYIDGSLDNWQYSSGTISTNNYKVIIGENAQQRGRYWNGLIDDVRVYNVALDANDINSIKNGADITSGLIAHWKLDEDGQREVVVTAAPAKTAIWCWSQSGDKQRWAQAAGAFYKVIRRN
jgi:cytoskeletal protein CcmA (bactofilin family)